MAVQAMGLWMVVSALNIVIVGAASALRGTHEAVYKSRLQKEQQKIKICCLIMQEEKKQSYHLCLISVLIVLWMRLWIR